MVERSLGFAAQAVGGRLEGASPEAAWHGAALDSRRVHGGELFFALAGERTDGHRFVAQALAAGAAAAVVRGGHSEGEGAALIRVDEPFTALHDLTRAVRATVPRRLVAVTGSSGKTSTKELLAAMLARCYRVARNPGNLNNLYGFPVSLLGIPDDTEWMVAEMGMSEPGELTSLSRLGRPDAAILLNVRPVHLEFFDSLAAIADAKAEILAGLAADGFVVGNRDDAEVRRVLEASRARVVWFGRAADADVRAEDVGPRGGATRPGSRFTLVTPGGRVTVELPLHGSFHVDNCLAAAACAYELEVPLEEIAAAAAAMEAAPMRGEVVSLPLGATLVDDSYNSNPEALELALESAAALPGERHWAVLGDMLELGPGSPAFHHEAGKRAAELGFSPVLAVGEESRELAAGAEAAGAEARWYPDAATAEAAARDELRPGDVVLVKGSRGIGLDRVATTLRKTTARTQDPRPGGGAGAKTGRAGEDT